MRIHCRRIFIFFCLLTCNLSILTSKARASELSYIHTDHLGSTSLVTDEQGNVVSQQVYYPYGSTRQKLKAEGLKLTAREYTGQVSDQAETGLYYYNARYYHPTIAKFSQADTVQGLNRYSYVSNNPIVRTDPSGHEGKVMPMEDQVLGPEYYLNQPQKGIWMIMSSIYGDPFQLTYYPEGYEGCIPDGTVNMGSCGSPDYSHLMPSTVDTLLVMGAVAFPPAILWASTPIGYTALVEALYGGSKFITKTDNYDHYQPKESYLYDSFTGVKLPTSPAKLLELQKEVWTKYGMTEAEMALRTASPQQFERLLIKKLKYMGISITDAKPGPQLSQFWSEHPLAGGALFQPGEFGFSTKTIALRPGQTISPKYLLHEGIGHGSQSLSTMTLGEAELEAYLLNVTPQFIVNQPDAAETIMMMINMSVSAGNK